MCQLRHFQAVKIHFTFAEHLHIVPTSGSTKRPKFDTLKAWCLRVKTKAATTWLWYGEWNQGAPAFPIFSISAPNGLGPSAPQEVFVVSPFEGLHLRGQSMPHSGASKTPHLFSLNFTTVIASLPPWKGSKQVYLSPPRTFSLNEGYRGSRLRETCYTTRPLRSRPAQGRASDITTPESPVLGRGHPLTSGAPWLRRSVHKGMPPVTGHQCLLTAQISPRSVGTGSIQLQSSRKLWTCGFSSGAARSGARRT